MNSVLFRGMSPEMIAQCEADLAARTKTYRKGDLILHAGEITEDLCIVLSGSVTIESTDYWGSCTVLSHAGAGDFFAETYAYLGEELLVDVRANEESEIRFLRVGALRDAAAPSHAGLPQASWQPHAGLPQTAAAQPHAGLPQASWQPQFIANLLSISMHKNLVLSNRIFRTSPKTIRGKLLSYLGSVSLQKHADEFDIPFDRQQLADYLGVDRTALSKELGKMKTEGILAFRKNHFQLFEQ